MSAQFLNKEWSSFLSIWGMLKNCCNIKYGSENHFEPLSAKKLLTITDSNSFGWDNAKPIKTLSKYRFQGGAKIFIRNHMIEKMDQYVNDTSLEQYHQISEGFSQLSNDLDRLKSRLVWK